MPFYEYECSACKHQTEVLQKISDAPLKKCPECGKQALKRLISAPVFRLKGGGWYETDFKSDNETKRNLAKEEAGESKSEDKTETKAESKPADAKPTVPAGFAVNAFAVRTLARAAEQAGAVLVHFGTDFVFDGSAREPYTEEDRPSPRSTYAASKLLGEWFALDAPRAFVLRVESLFGAPRDWTGRRGTLGTLVEGLVRGDELRVFTDRVVSPSYCGDIAAATRHLIESGAPSGLYHCENAGSATWLEVVEEAARVLGVTPRLQPVPFEEAGLTAARPRYSALSFRKLVAAGFPMPPWQDALRRWLGEMGAIK